MLVFSHNPWLVLASLCVALMAGFTGLSLTKGLSAQPLAQRKSTIVLSAIAMGGGIWSMHFVAMLGLQLPILFYYNFLITMMSALVAILVVGCALLILHFRQRTPTSLSVAGAIVGFGILAMHYIGMWGLEMCKTVYSTSGVLVAILTSCGLSIAAFRVAYGQRAHRNIVLGTLCFAVSVFLVHFIAMAGTSFTAIDGAMASDQLIDNEALAIGVALTSFVLCAGFLLTGVTFLPQTEGPESSMSATPSANPQTRMPMTDPIKRPDSGPPNQAEAGLEAMAETSAAHPAASKDPSTLKTGPQIPYEQDGRTLFIDRSLVSAVRAEGHYTFLYTQSEKLFCTWSISEASKRLLDNPFIKCHRSFLINPAQVTSFKRLKDNGVCYFDTTSLLDSVPVSRSCLSLVRKALGL